MYSYRARSDSVGRGEIEPQVYRPSHKAPREAVSEPEIGSTRHLRTVAWAVPEGEQRPTQRRRPTPRRQPLSARPVGFISTSALSPPSAEAHRGPAQQQSSRRRRPARPVPAPTIRSLLAPPGLRWRPRSALTALPIQGRHTPACPPPTLTTLYRAEVKPTGSSPSDLSVRCCVSNFGFWPEHSLKISSSFLSQLFIFSFKVCFKFPGPVLC